MSLGVALVGVQVGCVFAYAVAYVSACVSVHVLERKPRSEASQLATEVAFLAFLVSFGSLLLTPFACLAAYGGQVVSAAVRYPRTISVIVVMAVLSLVVSEFHRSLIYSADYLYTLSYTPVILPFLHAMNVVRLIGAMFVGVSNALAHALSTPSQVLLETAGACLETEDRGDVVAIAEHLARGTALLFGAFIPLLGDLTLEIDIRPAIAEFQGAGQATNDLVQCVCAADAYTGLVNAATHPFYDDRVPESLNAGANVLWDAVRLPSRMLFASRTASNSTGAPRYGGSRVPRLELDDLVDHLEGFLDNGAAVVDETLRKASVFYRGEANVVENEPELAEFNMPKVITSGVAAVDVGLELFRIVGRR